MKTLALTAAALLFCMPAAAQYGSGSNSQAGGAQGNTNTPDRSATAKGDKSSTTITGCISENNGKYMLTSKDHPTSIELTSSQDLKPHVGHTVSVTGMTRNSPNAAITAESGTVQGSKERDANTATTLQVNNLKMVSSTCSTSNSGTSGNSGNTGGYGSSGTSRNSGSQNPSDKSK